jgi:hypothetical protein
MMGRWKRDGNHSAPPNKLVQDSEGNEENGYPAPYHNKTKIEYPKEPNKAHKNTLKRNPARNHWEFHGDGTKHGEPKRTGGTQEIPMQ